MIHFERTSTINATPDAVWAILGRYMRVDEFAPLIVSVDALTKGDDGLGSRRRNNFANGTSVVEEVTDWVPGKGFTVTLSEMAAMPLDEASSNVRISAIGGQSKITWTFDYRVKYGPVGWLLGQTVMKLMMGKVIDGNLQGLADKVRSNAKT